MAHPAQWRILLNGAYEHPYTVNHEGIAFHRCDVTTLEASEIQKWFGDAKVCVLVGCAPRQPFSNCVLCYQKEEDGNTVEATMPDIVMMENAPTATKHSVFKNFKATLERLGYEVWVDIIDCARYGLPQRRYHTVLLASLHGEIKLHEPAALKAGWHVAGLAEAPRCRVPQEEDGQDVPRRIRSHEVRRAGADADHAVLWIRKRQVRALLCTRRGSHLI